jgi:hypothetical protein
MKIVTSADVKKLLPKFSGEDPNYRILPIDWFQNSGWREVIGCKEWPWMLGGSDCGKYAVRVAAAIYERFANKFCQWGSSGGGGSDGGVQTDSFADSCPSPLVGLCKYTRRDGVCHIVNVTLLEQDNGKLVPYYFERHPRAGLRKVYMEQAELDGIIEIKAY